MNIFCDMLIHNASRNTMFSHSYGYNFTDRNWTHGMNNNQAVGNTIWVSMVYYRANTYSVDWLNILTQGFQQWVHSSKEIIVSIWNCHYKQHALDFPSSLC